MNESHVTHLIRRIRDYLDELESEIRNHPENYQMSDEDYKQIKYYYSHESDDDGYPD